MPFSNAWFIAVLLLAGVGCASNRAGRENSPVGFVECSPPAYRGIFGDGRLAYEGAFYIKQNLSIIAHIPTRTEFYIRVVESNGATNADLSNKVLEHVYLLAKGHSPRRDTEVIRQSFNLPDGGISKFDVHYERSSFSGVRFDSDRYGRDKVELVGYVGCISAQDQLYLIAFAMIPPATPTSEKYRLERLLHTFLENMTLSTRNH